MKPPAFWQHGHTPPWPLLPCAWIYAKATARRAAQPGWRAPVPVICCGNPGAGGSGKTPLALDIAGRLLARGRRPAFLTRGHGGAARGPLRVRPTHTAADIGDEALLLVSLAPTYVGADRAATARLAIADGADVLVMDDGLQNPTLARTMALMVIDGGAGFGNGHVIPAGPLREPVAAAAARCRAAIMMGPDLTGLQPFGLPVHHAELVPQELDLAALPERLLAFAGIGRPAKFFDTLRAHGRAPVDTIAFADHYPYTAADIARIRAQAASSGATPVTTQKDFVRLPESLRAGLLHLRIVLAWSDSAGIEALLDEALLDKASTA